MSDTKFRLVEAGEKPHPEETKSNFFCWLGFHLWYPWSDYTVTKYNEVYQTKYSSCCNKVRVRCIVTER